MNELKYAIEQIWLAHQEAGLGTWVQIQVWVFAVLAIIWLTGWVWVGGALATRMWRRAFHGRSRGPSSMVDAPARGRKPPSWLAGMPT